MNDSLATLDPWSLPRMEMSMMDNYSAEAIYRTLLSCYASESMRGMSASLEALFREEARDCLRAIAMERQHEQAH